MFLAVHAGHQALRGHEPAQRYPKSPAHGGCASVVLLQQLLGDLAEHHAALPLPVCCSGQDFQAWYAKPFAHEMFMAP